MLQGQSIKKIILLDINIDLKVYTKILILYIRVPVIFILARTRVSLCSALYTLYKF